MRSLLVVLALSAIQAPTRGWRELLVVYGDDVRVEYLASVTRRRNVTWLPASQATRQVLGRGHVVLAGSLESNRLIRELAPEELGEWYERDGHVVQLVRPNPLNGDYRVTFVIGDIDKPVLRRRADVHVRNHDGKTVLLGFYDDEGELDIRRFVLEQKPSLEVGGFRFFTHGVAVPQSDLERLVVPGATADVHVYRSLEEKGLITDDTRTAHSDHGVFHVVLGVDEEPARFIAESFEEGPNLFVRRGRAAVRVYDDAALDRFDETARRLVSMSTPPAVSELVDDERFDAASPYVTDALSASYVRWLGSRTESSADDEWTRDLLSKPLVERPFPDVSKSFQRGVTYAHMGYQIHNGYLSARSDASLAKLSNLGIDAVAIVPYAFLRNGNLVGRLEVPRRAGSETDDDVIHAVRRARELGMTVMLKPQIWVRTGWPGDIEPTESFFREYRLWIVHYALMADANDVPLLAIGTELAKLTRGHRSRWDTIIDDVRRVYRGKLVYAANWGDEVLNVDFWDRLDYIGVDFYYPLSFEDDPSDEELAAGFESALDEIEKLHHRYRKPVLLTEIGYASTKSPWTKPHASDKAHEVSAEDQARAYAIAFAALEDETDWVHGMYWWKWPTNMERGGVEHRGFTPNGKPAEEVLRRWYGSRLQ